MNMEIDPDATYYRAIKDSFLWKAGAILTNEEDEDYYVPVNSLDVWNQSAAVGQENISSAIVESSPEWFERVYPAQKKDGEIMFGNVDETKKKYEFEFAPVKIQ